MALLSVDGVRLAGVTAALPAQSVDNLAFCTSLYGDAKKARNLIETLGIRQRRVAKSGTSSLALCLRAAERLLEGVDRAEIGAVIAVTFTPERAMPCNACQAQARLGLGRDVLAFDLSLACSGWPYGLYVAATLARATGRKVLLLDGDVQSPHVPAADVNVASVFADAGSAALIEPTAVFGAPWQFSFLTDGARGPVLELPVGGKIAMDGYGVFKFVATDVVRFLEDFLSATAPRSADVFVPHQANVFMVRQLARKLRLEGALWTSADVLGNSSSATIPVTLAWQGRHKPAAREVLVSGFGGGLSASAGFLSLDGNCRLGIVECADL